MLNLSELNFAAPQCKYPSDKVHMTYPKKFDDLPIQGKKVVK